MKIQLQIKLPNGRTYAWEFTGERFVIGRNPECDLALPTNQAESVSWQHARVEMVKGVAIIADLNSSNGTFVDNQPVDGQQPLAAGNRIAIGRNGPVLQIAGLTIGSVADAPEKPAKRPVFGFAGNEEPATTTAPNLPADSPPAGENPFATVAGGGKNSARDPAQEVAVPAQQGAPSQDDAPSTRTLLIHHQTRQKRYLMWAISVACSIGLVFFALLFVYPGYLRSGYRSRSHQQLVSHVEASVVQIKVPTGSGSGFVVDDKGTIVTNYHVMAGSSSATVVFFDGSEITVEGFVAVSPGKDIVLLRVKNSTKLPPPLPLAGKTPQSGETVYAFGSPKGYRGSVTDGLVSGVRSGAELRDIAKQSSGIDVYVKLQKYDLDALWIQTSTPISGGNSGGPLVNETGKVLGINTWVLAGNNVQNLNFASAAINIRHLLETSTDKVRPLSELP